MGTSTTFRFQAVIVAGRRWNKARLLVVNRRLLNVTAAVIALGCSTPRVHTAPGSGGSTQFQPDGGAFGGAASDVIGDTAGGNGSGGTQRTLESLVPLGGAFATGGHSSAIAGGSASFTTAGATGTRATRGGSSATGGTATDVGGTGGVATGADGTGGITASVTTRQAGGATAKVGSGGAWVSAGGGARASGGATLATGGGTSATGGVAAGAGGKTSGFGGSAAGTGVGDAGFAGGSTSFSFFAFGDTHLAQGGAANDNFNAALVQMNQIDPDALAGFNNGDLVDDATANNWALLDMAIQLSMFRKDVDSFEGAPRFLAVLGNHDLGFPTARADWLTQWNQHLPNQVSLGHNGQDGVYYSVSLRDALVIALDSQHPSSMQTAWLQALLTGAQANASKVKIALFHQPVYPCSSVHSPFEEGLAWVDLFERYGVRLVLVSHLHDYERTCPMRGGACSPGGVTYVNLGPIGATNYRTADRSQGQVDGQSADGQPRTDRFDCAGSEKILDFSKSGANSFCRVQVNGCRVTGSCFLVAAGSSLPFDSWQVDMCGP